MFDPAGLRVILGDVLLGRTVKAAVGREQHSPRRGGAFIEYQYQIAHSHSLLARGDMCHAARHMQAMELPPKPWPTGVAEQCEPLVRRVLAPNPSPYTYTGTQTYIVGAAGDRKSTRLNSSH